MEYQLESKYKVYELHESEIGIDRTHDTLINTHRYFDKKIEASEWIRENGIEGTKYAVFEVYLKKKIE